MSSSSSSSSEASKTRIRIVMSSAKSSQPPVATPRQQSEHHEVSPTPARGQDNVASNRSAASVAQTNNNNNNKASQKLSPRVLEGLKRGDMEFPINEECTSLKIVPSGNVIVAGFTDGTLRLFDLTRRPPLDSPSSDEDGEEPTFGGGTKNNPLVCSKTYQHYGAVACQIHARGVHTSLVMHVDCAEDGLYCFGGVPRGSMELVAVDLSKTTAKSDLLDLIQVHRHSDAKLKGFGACTRLSGPLQKYLLLTGRGIKNIHIWSFCPSDPNPWQCLYDAQTNGNSINMLHWRYDPNGLLQAMSKSDSQKMRVWDLSYEQHQGDASHPLFAKKSSIEKFQKKNTSRPKRPPYVDVASTESALGIAGSLCFGGDYNQVRVVSLDVANVLYNHTEMALPGFAGLQRGGRRQQRGDLQSIVRVAGMNQDSSHVLLELSNGSIVHYSQDSQSSASRLKPLGIFSSHEMPGASTTLCLERIAQGIVVAAMSTYNPHSGHGSIVLRPLDSQALSPMADKRALAAAVVAAAPSPNQGVQLFGGPPAKKKKKKQKLPTINEVVDTPSVNTKATQAPRVSLEDEAAGEGVAVSPEQRNEEEPKAKKQKKDGAMMKYLRPQVNDVAAQDGNRKKAAASKMASGAVELVTDSSRLATQPGEDIASRKQINDYKFPLAGKGPIQSTEFETPVPRKVNKIPIKNKSQKEAKHTKIAKTSGPKASASDRSEKKEKRVRSPRVPRKRTHNSSGAALHAVSSSIPAESSLLDVATALCDIRKTSPPKNSRTVAPTRSMQTPVVEVPEKKPYQPRRKRPRLLLASQLPSSSVSVRVEQRSTVDKAGTRATQETARMNLAAEHRAGHEMIRRKVLSTVDRIILSLTESPVISDGEAKIWFNEAISGYKQMLDELIQRQRMEAATLAAEQTLQREGKSAPQLQVSFPFPEVFKGATRTFEQFLLEKKH